MKNFSNDPRQTTTKFKCLCTKCRKVLPKGEDIYFFPSDKSVYCLPCGVGYYNYFLETLQDEETFNLGYSY